MKSFTLFLVKPHPAKEILNQKCPVPEKYKYAWEPITLKIMAQKLMESFPDQLNIEIWHLIHKEDDFQLIDRVSTLQPDFVIFTEIDVLVNEVSRLATEIKAVSPNSYTIVGGKQTSLLRNGDLFPFNNIDLGIRGDGPTALLKFFQLQLESKWPEHIPGMIYLDGNNYLVGEDDFSPREWDMSFDNTSLHEIPVKNHPLTDYLDEYQHHPTILPEIVRSSPIFIGTGCPFGCYFCQSPVEYGESGLRKALLNPAENIAQEIAWLHYEYGVKNFFSLEPNMNFKHLLDIYQHLEKLGIDYMPVSGFVRAADIIKFREKGVLQELVKKGVRLLSIGLDVSFKSKRDIFNKSFSYDEMLHCLEICEEMGILVLSTVVANPDSKAEDLQEMLDTVKILSVAEVDVRFAIALRNTNYYKDVEKNLIYHPDENRIYFDRQNYRYQTVQFPGKITPEESYQIVNDFYDTYLFSDEHISYVKRMMKNHPDTQPYFERQYQKYHENSSIFTQPVENLITC